MEPRSALEILLETMVLTIPEMDQYQGRQIKGLIEGRQLFAVITGIPGGETAEFKVPDGMDGRYVYIGIAGRQDYLTLCEVEVFGSALD
ncbi:hypothetical protein NQZ68_020064 [Dissostichus eleginoides]|nr:hypothetical protein NQZ68_020064 [Dissostichus eleginoides]